VFLHFAGPRSWYFLIHHSDETENNFDCVRDGLASPEGNRSLVIADVCDIRWVYNIHRLFTLI